MNLPVNKLNSKAAKFTLCCFIFILICIICTLLISSCSKKNKTVIIWTNYAELALYGEIFNASQTKVQVLVVYKEDPVNSLPPAKDEEIPDIVIGSFLKNDRTKKNFLSVEYLFSEMNIGKQQFYAPLLEMGKVDTKQYLLPVSFNLPMVIFSKKHEDNIPNNYTISLEEIRDIGSTFNTKNKTGIFTTMGFAPSWNDEFLYTVAKLNGANFAETNKHFTWNNSSLENTTLFLKEWTANTNDSTSAENDFLFKYLYTPEIKWISQEKNLFAYTTSNIFFATAPEKILNIEFRWLAENEKTPVEDTALFMGMYRGSHNLSNAEQFITWFFDEENQRQMLDWAKSLNLVSSFFGVAGGFSSIKSVNEFIFPTYYPIILGNLPQEEQLLTPNIYPKHWELMKKRVIIPYIKTSSNTENKNSVTMGDLLREWQKQYF